MEDGCSKRFDIGTLDLRAESFDGMHPNAARSMAPMGHIIPPPGSLPPMTIAPLCPPNMLGAMGPSLMRPREHISTGDHWGR